MQLIGDLVGIEHLHHVGGGVRFPGTVQRAHGALIAPQVKHHGEGQQACQPGHKPQPQTRVKLDPAQQRLEFIVDCLQHVQHSLVGYSGILITSSNAVVNLLRTCSKALNATLAF